MISLCSVTKRYGVRTPAVADLSLEVNEGEVCVLLGPSGCGKTTALNCLAGLLPLTGGGIWLDNARIDRLKPEARGFGMVFQNYALFPHMSVRRNVGFGLRMQKRGRAEIAEKVEAALALVRLGDQGDKLPGQLSGGQQQRVAIARAIVIEPPLVLMDEPLSNLDAKLRLEMRAEIRRIHDQVGSTTIYVTHDQDEAVSLADRVVVMRGGTVRQVGPPAELYARPAHADVAEFMGYRNLLPTRVLSSDAGTARIAIGDAELIGTVIETLPGEAALAAIRPDDLVPRADGTLAATVAAVEYRGRGFFGTARTAAGTELFFRSDARVEPGEALRLGADRNRILIYAGVA